MIDPKHLTFFKSILNDNQIVTSTDELKVLGTDWTKVFPPMPSLGLLPKSTQEVSDILKYCDKNNLKVVPSGGRTGLCAGAVASQGEIVVSLQKMNQITSVDPIGLTLRAQAGAITEDIQTAAKEVGLFFALDLAAKGSSMIGGNLATNAGGLKLIRYGGTREQVLGIEVVLANGEVLDIDTSLRKNNTGYDLKQLFIGSEGTLGIITNVTLRLVAKPKNVELVCLGVDSFENILEVLKECNLSGISISAFEFFTDKAHKRVLKCFPQLNTPFETMPPYFLLIEAEATKAEFESLIERTFEKGVLSDGIIAQSSSEFKDFWALRENITESLAASGHVRKNDISIPILDLAKYSNEILSIVEKSPINDVEIILFGHIGDGNIHINYLGDKSTSFTEFNDKAKNLENQFFESLKKYKGSISAEHGIGMTKKKDLHFSCSPLEIEMMKKIKSTFDPNNTLNPGKIFDL